MNWKKAILGIQTIQKGRNYYNSAERTESCYQVKLDLAAFPRATELGIMEQEHLKKKVKAISAIQPRMREWGRRNVSGESTCFATSLYRHTKAVITTPSEISIYCNLSKNFPF